MARLHCFCCSPCFGLLHHALQNPPGLAHVSVQSTAKRPGAVAKAAGMCVSLKARDMGRQLPGRRPPKHCPLELLERYFLFGPGLGTA